ncbi:ribokinase [Sinirhodobacter huangdaonensis]|uniref:Ribokinase n=1 Tax=Paenirhodobacter huangdaonensis TaxID=2501515 RepID=A0A443LTP6_9RHOB|nr:ribokinase [Sinirhodobacter huangdaonensis]RWR52548.1 ribokinase [Sinirhodobacter huangdaonensis]
MTVYTLGSINADHLYRLPHLPAPGETLAALSYSVGLGGKGANQSVALARAGADVRHIGAVGADGLWMVARLTEAGVDCAAVSEVEGASGHAIIAVDAAGENAILLHPGANRMIGAEMVRAALEGARPGDTLVLQNETSAQVEAARIGQEQGLFVVYSAAPFEAEAVAAVLPYLSLLIMNEVEAAQLCSALSVTFEALTVPHVVVTRGARGAEWHDRAGAVVHHAPAFAVTPVDTTAAGDTFAGYLVAGLAGGLGPEAAMRLASGAAALKVTRAGTADAIPARDEVMRFLAAQPSE